MPLDKASILAAINAAADIKTEKVHVPEWKTDVYLKVLSGTERDQFESGYADQRMQNFRVRFLVMTLCDQSGERLYDDEQVTILGKRSALVISRLFEAAWKLNMLSPEAADEAGESSGGGRKNASTTDSPSASE
jgi:hypothetical protein